MKAFKNASAATQWVRRNATGMVSVLIQTKWEATAHFKTYYASLPSGGFRK